ncbi:MAG: hypothetical protein QM784_24545 [Polyangiaceae bacterium]
MLGNPAVTPQPLTPVESEPDEPRLAPWALVGMAVLALAAGAAAVYGLFHLLRDPEPLDPLAPADSATTQSLRKSAHPSGADRSRAPGTTSSRSIGTSSASASPNVNGKPNGESSVGLLPSARDVRAESAASASAQSVAPRPPNEAKTTETTLPPPSTGNATAPGARTSPEPTNAESSGHTDSNRAGTNPIDALPMVTDRN